MHDLVEMIKDDLVVIKIQSTWCYKKGSNAVRSYHCARPSRVVELQSYRVEPH